MSISRVLVADVSSCLPSKIGKWGEIELIGTQVHAIRSYVELRHGSKCLPGFLPSL